MSEPVYPIVTREETADGFIMRWDYGPKQGVTVGIVHRVPATDEEHERMRRGINAIIRPHGYELAD